jgi:steroid delta-isomerase-like uncharacterized protein
MTSDEIRAFIERYLDLWEREDVSALVKCYTNDCVVKSPMFQTIQGREAIEASFRKLFLAFGDYAIKLEDIVMDRGPEERAVFLYTAEVTHRGEIFGMPGTGRRVESTFVFFLRFENGLIAAERRVYDFTGVLIQLGVLKAKAV